MDDKEMIEQLNREARIKLMTADTLKDIPRYALLPDHVQESMLAGEHGEDLLLPVGEESRLEAGYLTLAAKLLTGEEKLPAEQVKALVAKLRAMADTDADYAERQDSEAKEKEQWTEYGLDDDEEEDDTEDDAETMRDNAEEAREDAKFLREVADRLEVAK